MSKTVKDHLFGDLVTKVITLVIGSVAALIATWAVNFMQKPTETIKDLTQLSARLQTIDSHIATLSNSFEGHLTKEKEYRERRSVEVKELSDRLQKVEMDTMYLKGRLQVK